MKNTTQSMKDIFAILKYALCTPPLENIWIFCVSYLIFVKVSTNLDLRVKYALHCTTSSAKWLNAWNIKLVVINLEGCTGFWKRIFKSVQKTTICGKFYDIYDM